MGLSDTMKDILIAMAGDLVGLTVAKHLLGKKEDEAGGDKKTGTPSVEHIVADGILNSSDESAFIRLLGLLIKEKNEAAVAVISSFLARDLLTHNQKRVFRVVMGKMADDVAVEFLKSFAALKDDTERLKVCEAGGITTTMFDYVTDGFKRIEKVARANDHHFAPGTPLGDSAADFAKSAAEFKDAPTLKGLGGAVSALFSPLLKKT